MAIDNLDDPRVAPYRNLKDHELAKQGGLFIAEGEHLVRRLLASDYVTHSLLIEERHRNPFSSIVAPEIPVYVVPDDLMTGILGFKFHSGVIGVGHRKPAPSLSDLLGPPDGGQGANHRGLTLVVCPEIINHDNLGALIRIAAAFGVHGLLLGERSCDPFWRRSVRVSMGTIFKLPVWKSDDLKRDLLLLRQNWGVHLAATVLDATAQPLASATRPGGPDRLALLVGSESQGLPEEYINLCDRKLTIPMHLGTDSLNVAIATAVFLYHFTPTAVRSSGV